MITSKSFLNNLEFIVHVSAFKKPPLEYRGEMPILDGLLNGRGVSKVTLKRSLDDKNKRADDI